MLRHQKYVHIRVHIFIVYTGQNVMALSDAWLKANKDKPRDKVEIKTDRDGLSVRVSPKGKITFQLRYRYAGKAKRMDVGSYPSTSLKEARSEVARLRAKLKEGHDPKIVKQLELDQVVKADTFITVFNEWYEGYCKKRKQNHKAIRSSFEQHVFPTIGNLPLKEVTLQHWMSTLEAVSEKTPAIGDRLLTNTKQILKWAVKRQLVEYNVLSDITSSQDLHFIPGVGKRSLSDDEIRTVWCALRGSKMMEKNKIYLRLCLIYGCRNGELRLSKKEHFDLDNGVWTVPPENHKLGKRSGKPLLRPITDQIAPFIVEAKRLSGHGAYMFPMRGASEPMSPSAITSFPKNLINWIKHNKGIVMEPWSTHDLRKTARTNFSTLTDPHIAEIMLGHKLPGQWQVYDHYDYLKEQGEAYNKWTERLIDIVS